MRSLRPALLHALGQATRARPAAAFSVAARDPAGVQGAYLRDLMQRNADTAYGRAHGFAEIASPAAYARRVPFMTAADLEPWVARLMKGERKLLSADDPVYYVRTTGSTGNAKHIPITRAYKKEFQRTVHVALWHLYARFPSAFFGRALYFVGSRKVARAEDGCDVGTMSGFNFTELPPLLRAVYAWPYELFEVADLRARSWLALWLATLGDISLIAGIFPAPIVYLLRDLAERSDELAHHLERGTIPSELALAPEQRAFFERLARPRPDLAARLRRAARAAEGEVVREAWPHLRLTYCWTTATAGLYVPELERRLGPQVAIRDAIYSACEGWCSIPIGEPEPGGALATQSVYFEFIPEAEYEAGGRDTRTAAELEDGRRYYIVITNSTGLYRYLLGDVVEVCGRYHDTPRIKFVRKGGAATNLVGEKLDESHATRAVQAALAEARLEATWFTLVPEVSDRPGYALVVEPAPASSAAPDLVARLETLAAAADRALGELSYDYGRLRSGNQLAAVRVRRLDPGSYDRVRQQKVQDGSAEAQLKTAHLVPDAASLPPELRGR